MKKNENIETKYKHPNEHIFVIASRPIVHGEVLAKCTCGYETREYDKKMKHVQIVIQKYMKNI